MSADRVWFFPDLYDFAHKRRSGVGSVNAYRSTLIIFFNDHETLGDVSKELTRMDKRRLRTKRFLVEVGRLEDETSILICSENSTPRGCRVRSLLHRRNSLP